MADAVKALTHWRRNGRELRHEHTREVREVKQEFPPEAKAALLKVAMSLDEAQAKIARLEAIISRLALEARQGDAS